MRQQAINEYILLLRRLSAEELVAHRLVLVEQRDELTEQIQAMDLVTLLAQHERDRQAR